MKHELPHNNACEITSLSNSRLDDKAILIYGFTKIANEKYRYQTEILDGQFTLLVHLVKNKPRKRNDQINYQIFSAIIDNETGEPYNLHHIAGSTSSFAHLIKEIQADTIQEIVKRCFVPDRFHNPMAQDVIDYLKQKYNCELEYLWKKTPNNAICRRKDNAKCFLALLTDKLSSLLKIKGQIRPEDDITLTVLNLRINPWELDQLIDNDDRYFRGYHMDKMHWVTICLDGQVPLEEIHWRIDQSYMLAERTNKNAK